MVDYGKAIKRPFTDWTKLAFGSLLSVIPVVNLIMLGYGLQAAVNKKLPTYDGYKKMFVEGFLALVIGIIFYVPAAVFFIPSARVFLDSQAISGTIFLALVLAVLAEYTVPYALVHFVKKQSFAAAFDFRRIFSKTFTGKYFKSWIVAAVWLWLLAFVTQFLALLALPTLVGPVIFWAIYAYISLVTGFTIIGDVYKELK